MSGEPPGTRMVRAYLDDAERDLDGAVRLLVPPPNRLAAYHLQQAAEKLAKAVRLHRGFPPTIDHNIDVLLAGLPADDAWRGRLQPVAHLSAYATAYRYPTPGAKVREPNQSDLKRDVTVLTALLALARTDLLGPTAGE